MCVCICLSVIGRQVCESVDTCHAPCVQIRGQLTGVGSLLLLCGSLRLTQAVRLNRKHLCPLRHLASPLTCQSFDQSLCPYSVFVLLMFLPEPSPSIQVCMPVLHWFVSLFVSLNKSQKIPADKWICLVKSCSLA